MTSWRKTQTNEKLHHVFLTKQRQLYNKNYYNRLYLICGSTEINITVHTFNWKLKGFIYSFKGDAWTI